MKKNNISSGFTLIELLVVIAVIALLLSVIVPSLGRAKEKARMLICMSNTRQIGYQLTVYNNNHNGYFPLYTDAYLNGGEKWTSNTYRYWPYFIDPEFERFSPVGFPKHFICPSIKETEKINESNLPYGMNYRILGKYNGNTPQYAKVTDFKNPGNIIMISESRRYDKNSRAIDNTLGVPWVTPPANPNVYTDPGISQVDCSAYLAYRHPIQMSPVEVATKEMVDNPDCEPGGKVSVLWLDLHATTEDREMIKDPQNVHFWGVKYIQK